MRNLPIHGYCGLTIITKQSRFDTGGKLITGYAGEYFDTCLHPISRNNCDIVTIDDFKELLPGTKCVLLLGEEAWSLCKTSDFKEVGINDIRGYTNTIGGIVYLATFHHQEILDRKDFESDDSESADNIEAEGAIKGHGRTKRKNWKWWFYYDIKKCIKILRQHQGIVPEEAPHDIKIYPQAQEFIAALAGIKNEDVVIDIETTKNFTMTCFGLGLLKSKKVFVVPWKRYNFELAYTEEECREIIRALIICFAENRIIAHNAMFDLLILSWKYKVLPPKKAFDTMVAWHRLRPECEKSLGHLISFYTWYSYHKNEGIFEPKSSAQDQQLWNYNAKDIITTGIIYERLQEDIKKSQAEESVQLACRKIPAYLSLSLFGARLDIEKRNIRISELLQKQEALDVCLSCVCQEDLNPRSSKQVSEYLYEKLGLECPNEDDPTQEKTLRKLQLKHNIPSVQLILASRGARKNASSLQFNAWGPRADRMTCSWILAGPDTYRLGSRTMLKRKNVAKSGYGTNFQNWSKGNRDLILPDEGKVLIQVDQAGAEALIVAYLCRLGKFRQLFIYGIKPHVFVALHLFKDAWKARCTTPEMIDILCTLPPDQLAAHPAFKPIEKLIKESDDWPAKERYYFMAKMTCHSANYGIKWPTFQSHVLEKSEGQVALENSQARKFLEHYHMLFPELRAWHMETQAKLKLERKLKNLFGHPRQFNEPWGESLFKQAYAFVPQSTVGQITNYAICELCEAIDRREDWTLGLDILQNGHDSVLAQCPEGRESIVVPEIQKRLERELVSPRREKFRMKAECQTGKNWKPAGKSNPAGLKNFI